VEEVDDDNDCLDDEGLEDLSKIADDGAGREDPDTGVDVDGKIDVVPIAVS
jgi:hypothetical protein